MQQEKCLVDDDLGLDQRYVPDAPHNLWITDSGAHGTCQGGSCIFNSFKFFGR